MPIEAIVAAKYLCRVTDWSVAPSCLSKMLYLAHGQHLKNTGKPLLAKEPFVACVSGPEIRAFKQGFPSQCDRPISRIRAIFIRDLDAQSTEARTIEETARKLMAVSELTKKDLVSMTMHSNGAWARHFYSFRGDRIRDDSIRQEAESRANDQSPRASMVEI